jgi:hypothetical protein
MQPPVRRLSAWIVLVQCLLALSWTMYALFLPELLARVGLARRWVIAILIADQIVFALSDWFAGAYSDRLARVYGAIGRPVAAVALVTGLLMALMPWLAQAGSATLFLLAVLLWSAGSSALRAPVFSLLGKVGGVSRKSGVVCVGLVGVSVAAALGPAFTEALRGIDPQLPMALGGMALALAAALATRVEAGLPRAGTEPRRFPQAVAVTIALAVLLAALGTQLHSLVALRPLFSRFVAEHAGWWTSSIWLGFALGLLLGRWAAVSPRALCVAACAMLLATLLGLLAPWSPTLGVLVLVELAIGAAWAVFSVVTLVIALSLGGANSAGTPAGMIFSALAAAAVLRLALSWAGLPDALARGWFIAACWMLGAALALLAGLQFQRLGLDREGPRSSAAASR